MDWITNAILNLGFGGGVVLALVWFLRHLVTVTIPDLVKSFREELARERELFRMITDAERIQRLSDHGQVMDRLREITLIELRQGTQPERLGPVSVEPNGAKHGD